MSVFEITQISNELTYCVYEHEIDGVVFYVGSGPLSRAFEVTGTRRSETWREYHRGQLMTVRVVSLHADRNAARKAEYRLIRAKRPYANISGTFSPRFEEDRSPMPVLSDCPTARVVLCVTDGLHYPTVKAAAEHYGVTAGAISNSIRGRYPTVKGHAFRWALA